MRFRIFNVSLIIFLVVVLFGFSNYKAEALSCPSSGKCVSTTGANTCLDIGMWEDPTYAGTCGPAPSARCCVIPPTCPGQCRTACTANPDPALNETEVASARGYCAVQINNATAKCCVTATTELAIDCSKVANPLLVPKCALEQAGALTTYLMTIGTIAGGVIAVFYIFYGAYLILTARDDTGKVEEGRKTLLYAFLGLVVSASAYVLLQLIGPILNIPVTFTPSAVYAQEVQTTYQVSGRVTDDVTKATLKGTNVAVYVLEDGKWKLWPAQQYENQRNPQASDEYGEFDFRVPPGTYYLAADSLGYHGARSDQFTIENAPKRIDIALSAGITFWNILFVVGVGGFCLVIVYILGRMAFVYWKKQQIRQMVLKQAKKSSQDKVANLYPENDPSQSNSPQS